MSLLPDFFMSTMDFNKEEFINLQTWYISWICVRSKSAVSLGVEKVYACASQPSCQV